ncbi:enolase-phosphatase E1 [Dermatophagoides farinae]|uniref:Enolase-phosphatase E1 n=1 Tax=Dermatophagoides farinae TaxID=6954 RepID=A0A922KWH1_DERFA|nr:enolase-phosphatase E1-like [Dermatophagoides farinae]KAH7640102.1 enolase-phosphatase e-1-like protein [Dermatophagoides farinae]KAH9493495.1 Enolase-phosphatase E1 [Dermatophagoides farinae]
MVQVKVKKPNAVLFDIAGTVARESFVEKLLIPYFKVAYRVYLENNWSKPECAEAVKKLAEAAEKDSKAPKIQMGSSKKNNSQSSVSSSSMKSPSTTVSRNRKKDAIEQVCRYIQYCMDNEKETKAYAFFRFQVWFDGYDRNKLSTPVYSDVAITVQRWKNTKAIKLYILSNGWAEASRKFMSKTSHGDLNLVIDDHFDTSIGPLLNPETFTKVAAKIGQSLADVIFLTKSAEQGKAAKQAGMNVILVLTHGPAVDQALEICRDIPIARTFTDIEFV